MPGGNFAAPSLRLPGALPLGPAAFVKPFVQQWQYTISGVTKDSAGVALAAATVMVFDQFNVHRATVISDAAGNYQVGVTGAASMTFRCDAYKAGSPDLAGTTINTLTPIPA